MELNEMAINKADLIIKCNRLGKVFIKYFIKCLDDISDQNIERLHHHCKEMQAWWDDVKDDRLKSNNRKLTDTQLIDWFFSAGMIYEDFIPTNDVIKYESFIDILLDNHSQDIYDIMCNLFD